MNSFFSDYTALAPYFKDKEMEEINLSANPFFEALKRFDAEHTLKYLKNSKPAEVEAVAEQILVKLKANMSKIKAFKRWAKSSSTAIDKINYLHKYLLYKKYILSQSHMIWLQI